MRELTPLVPRRVVLEPSGVALEQEARRAGLGDQLVDAAPVAGLQVAGEERLLAVDHDAAAKLERERGLAEKPCDLTCRGAPPARNRHHLGAGPVAGLQPTHAQQCECAVGVLEEAAAATEQRAV